MSLVKSRDFHMDMPYQGREVEKQVARYILGNSSRLKAATFYHKSIDPEEKLAMLMELSLMLRRSSTCGISKDWLFR